jgi:hypothetical protein
MNQSVERARGLIQSAIVCDAILPWTQYGRAELRNDTLPRYAAAGFGMVSLSLCSDAEGLRGRSSPGKDPARGPVERGACIGWKRGRYP